jgi:hypothetical protein
MAKAELEIPWVEIESIVKTAAEKLTTAMNDATASANKTPIQDAVLRILANACNHVADAISGEVRGSIKDELKAATRKTVIAILDDFVNNRLKI